MANGEIAHYEQLLHLSQCFHKSFAAESSESVCMWERAKLVLHPLHADIVREDKLHCKELSNEIK